jgi:hypothetical protein
VRGPLEGWEEARKQDKDVERGRKGGPGVEKKEPFFQEKKSRAKSEPLRFSNFPLSPEFSAANKVKVHLLVKRKFR